MRHFPPTWLTPTGGPFSLPLIRLTHMDLMFGKPPPYIGERILFGDQEAIINGIVPLAIVGASRDFLLLLEPPRKEMQKISRFPLPLEGEFKLSLPDGNRIVDVQTQFVEGVEIPVLWAIINPTHEPTDRIFRLFKTEEELTPKDLQSAVHIKTFQMRDGIVWHLFEKRP